ncbi:AMP-binding protein [Psychrosphaera sp. 1_MG-2023]|uniref:AMP-binding protein n=1 Tax=Psychrosphaera sp. 1_MG-2023 TaxID=3062643 RepID=UPI0026E32DEB|nr:AMP-binding protein [Psychrosphaera sp. 1_MG-2023]MDO6717981.1 AMP-binding protein [Psychrosphaera sp. 1_MG-2023]
MTYFTSYQAAKHDPEGFWAEESKTIEWFKNPDSILSKDSNGFYRWFDGGELNTSYLALDCQVKLGLGDNAAIIYDSPVTNTKLTITYNELLERVSKFASVLAAQNVQKGDRVLIYMPMIPEALIAMLATARLGAIHSVVFGGFAAHELAIRIDDAEPKVIVTASCGIEIDKVIPYKPIVDKAIASSDPQTKPNACIVYQRSQLFAKLDQEIDINWMDEEQLAPLHPPVPVKATDPLYILYTSGTTGKPKGVVRDNGGHAIAMKYSMKTVYGASQGDVFWAASDVGWVVGHSYILYGPLMSGCTTLLYEGKPIKTPDAGAFWRVCAEHKVNILFTAPTAFRAIRKEDPKASLLKEYDLSNLKRLYLAGERLDPSTYLWLKEATHKPVIDHWWQTETGWPIAGIPVGLEQLEEKLGSAGLPIPGFQVEILNQDGHQCEAGKMGTIAIKLPLPPGCLPTIWKNNDRFKAGYLNSFDGYYVTGDGGYVDENGYLFVMGRTDDVINVAGHRLSTGEMEDVISGHTAIAECAVMGIHCDIKGQVPYALVVLKNGIEYLNIYDKEIKSLIREQIGAIASLKEVAVAKRLPKTRSGKVLRKLMKQMIDGEDIQIPSTIDDVSVISELKSIFSQRLPI